MPYQEPEKQHAQLHLLQAGRACALDNQLGRNSLLHQVKGDQASLPCSWEVVQSPVMSPVISGCRDYHIQ